VDAFICYNKQKCKVVSLNLAHPVGLLRLHKKDYEAFGYEIPDEIHRNLHLFSLNRRERQMTNRFILSIAGRKTRQLGLIFGNVIFTAILRF